MTYPTTLTHQGESHVRPYADEIARLQPGTGFEIHFEDPSQTSRTRYYLYAWRYINELDFVIRQTSPKVLRIERTDVPARAGTIVRTKHEETPAQAFVKDKLLSVETEDSAIRAIYEAINAGTLEVDDGPEALNEWRRIQG
jgi:hypothetical protein